MATPPERTQWANIVAYHLLLSLVNLLNLPLPDGTFIPRAGAGGRGRSQAASEPRLGPQLRVLDKDVARLRMLKSELDPTQEAEVRGYLVAPKALLFELEVALHQWPDLRRNDAFFADLERMSTLLSTMRDLGDARGVRDLAYKLSVMLPFYEDEDAMRERNATAARWYERRA